MIFGRYIFFNLFIPTEDLLFCFLVLKTNLLGSSNRRVQVGSHFGGNNLFHSGRSKESSSCPAYGFWRRAWFRPSLHRRTNEHVTRVSSFLVSDTAVALYPPCWEAQHAGHLLASSYFTLQGIEMIEQTEEEFYLQ